MPAKRPLIITPGDPDGIGPEVVWKTLKKLSRSDLKDVILIGSGRALKKAGANLKKLELIEPPSPPAKLHAQGFISGWSIVKAVKLIQAGEARALVTGPINKERLNKGGFFYPGHTEFLADLCANPRSEFAPGLDSSPETRREPRLPALPVTMMLANSKLRVSLVTTHVALARVSSSLSSERIERTIRHTLEMLLKGFKIAKPRIAVCSLNPHAGENGLFGREEIELIGPAIARAQAAAPKGSKIEGPLPADTLFALGGVKGLSHRYDAVVCMYHDQGLIPVKLIDFAHTVNVSLGLPLIRTSVDHGTAFDIAGKNKADPRSFESALKLARKLSR